MGSSELELQAAVAVSDSKDVPIVEAMCVVHISGKYPYMHRSNVSKPCAYNVHTMYIKMYIQCTHGVHTYGQSRHAHLNRMHIWIECTFRKNAHSDIKHMAVWLASGLV